MSMTTVEETILKAIRDTKNSAPTKTNKDSHQEQEEEVPQTPEEPVELKSNQKHFSEVFGFVPPSGIDHAVTVHEVGDWDEEVRKDIPKKDKTYTFDKEALEYLVVAIEHGDKVNIVGPPGCGKTTLVKEVAAYLNRPYMRLNGKDGIEPSSMLGMPIIVKGAMEWRDGLVPIACKQGYLLAFDEWTKTPPGVMMSLQWLLEEDGKLVIDDKPGSKADKEVVPHKEFRMVCCDNAKGLGDGIDKFAATQVQDSSTLDRFPVSITMDYLPFVDEEALLKKKFSKVQKNTLSKYVKVATLVRKGYNQGELSLTMSPRSLVSWVKYASIFKDPHKGFSMSYLQKLSEDSEKKSAEHHFQAVFGSK